MSEVGTLIELDVKPGDVVRATAWGYDRQFNKYESDRYIEINWTIYEKHPKGFCDMCAIHDTGYTRINEGMIFRIVSRATQPAKLWRDMTDVEKGALLLAKHEGKVIEMMHNGAWVLPYRHWHECDAYRVRPEPKIEVVAEDVELDGKIVVLEYTTINGDMDKSTIKARK